MPVSGRLGLRSSCHIQFMLCHACKMCNGTGAYTLTFYACVSLFIAFYKKSLPCFSMVL